MELRSLSPVFGRRKGSIVKRWFRYARLLEDVVQRKGRELRALSRTELESMTTQPTQFRLEGRRAQIALLVEPAGSELRVVVQGLVDTAFIGQHVALDGFYLVNDGSIRDMPDDEYRQYD
jgi:hypothetical protein